MRPGLLPVRVKVAALAALALAGCAALPRNAVPPDLVAYAVIPGMPDVRAPAGRPSAPMARDLAKSFEQESPDDFPVGPDGRVHYAHLALSGGEPTGRSVRAIARRVFDSAGMAATIGDLHRIYAASLREDAGYHWITIPERADVESREIFDPRVMAELYDLGLRTALAGPVWRTAPPGLNRLPPP